MKLQKPERHRTVTGRFTTLGEFMYNNRHLIDEDIRRKIFITFHHLEIINMLELDV